MKFKVTSTIVWDLESPSYDSALEIANKYLGEFPNQDNLKDFKFVVRLDKLKDKIERIKLGEFKLEDVIPYITKYDIKKEYEYNGVKHAVKMNSNRYFIFREYTNCVACGLKGTKMFLECNPTDKSPHFNLYGEENEKLILMTKDHIHAKSCGGEDRHSNFQVMCLICNNLKGNSNLTLNGVRELRRLFNENKDKITKKKLHLLIEEAKTRLEKPWSNEKKRIIKGSLDAVITICDINLYKNGSEIYGKSTYDNFPINDKHIGGIKKETCLEPLVVTKDKIMCKLSEEEVVVFHLSLVRLKNKNDY